MKSVSGKSFIITLFLCLLQGFLFAEAIAAPAVKEITAEALPAVPTASTPKTIVNSDGSTTITALDGSVSLVPAPVPVPEIKSVNPVKLYPGKCYLDFKITGVKFAKSILVKFATEHLTIDNLGEIAPDSVKLSVTVREGAKPGKYDLLVQNSADTTAMLKNAVQIMSKPEVNAVVQKEIRQGSLRNEVTLGGTGFLPGAKIDFLESTGELVSQSVEVKSDKEIKLSIDVASSAKPGEIKFRLVNPDGESAGNKLQVTTALGINSVLPQTVPQGSLGLEISIKGSNFSKSLKVETKDDGLAVNNIFVLSENEAVINVTVADLAVPGKKELVLFAPDGGNQKFYLTVSLRPVLSAVTPDQLPQGAENRIITITGNNFSKDTQIKFSTPGIRITNSDTRMPQQILAVINVSDRALEGAFDVLAVNPDGGTGILKNSFKINLNPAIKEIMPASAVQGVFAQEIEIRGQGFTKSTAIKISGEGIVVGDVEYAGPGLLKTRVTVGAKATLEKRDVYLSNTDGGSFEMQDCFGINKVDKESIYYGDINSFRKPAKVNKKKIYLEHPLYQVIVRDNISSDVARYWLTINKINESVRDIYKLIQKKYEYDLIGEVGYVTDKEGNPVKDVPDITDLVIRELEK